MPTSRTENIASPKAALKQLAMLVDRSMLKPNVREAAFRIVSDCPKRNQSGVDPADIDLCQLTSIYEAVKNGTMKVKGLEKGVGYMADPRGSDYFIAPHRLLDMCAAGACFEDCDSQAALVAALAGAIGFKVGLRAWGKPNAKRYSHVYSVVMFPKIPPPNRLSSFGDVGPQKVVAMDTTVYRAEVGWEPEGRHMDFWLK